MICHSGLRVFLEDPAQELAEFERTGYIRWVSDLARVPQDHGVSNVYADLGTCSAVSATSSPRFCAAMMGTLIKGLGWDHVFWGTHSVWYGSPQWQIEAFRRLEIPEDLQKHFGFAPLGAADGVVKSGILGYTGARFYGLELHAELSPWQQDGICQLKASCMLDGPRRSNAAYGYVVKAG